MNNRQRILAILHYQPVDRLPVLHFGYWPELLDRWAQEGHITAEEAKGWKPGNEMDAALNVRLGFDTTWVLMLNTNMYLDPPLEKLVLEERPDGSLLIRNQDGVTTIEKPGLYSIPMEIDHIFKGRKEWEETYKPRLQWNTDRLNNATVYLDAPGLVFEPEGRLALERERQTIFGIWAGSMLGIVRNWVGLMELSRMMVRKDPLLDEILETLGEMLFQGVKACLELTAQFDFIHFWEDIAFRSGPLVNPRFFAEKIAPHYRRINDLALLHGIDLASVDSDGKIDALVPIWLESGVNVMFPIEVGAWGGSYQPWREQYGRQVRGIGGMRKQVLDLEYRDINLEIERLRPLVDLGATFHAPTIYSL